MIIVDLETTGISPQKNCVVSLGAVNYATDESFYGECHIYDDSEVNEIALSINGFTKEQITDQTKLPAHELYYDFQEWCKSINPPDAYKILLAGHNVGHFDILFLEELASYIPNHHFPFSYRTIDSHTLGYAAFGESLSLDQLALKLGLLAEEKPHHALNGAKHCKKVLSFLLNKTNEFYK